MTTEEEKNARLKDRFSRWQSKTNEQFGYMNNLLLILSIGSIGFVANLIIKTDFLINDCYAKTLLKDGTILLLVSIVSGTCLGLNRLIDFRKTTQTINARLKENYDELEILKEQTEYLGKLSWSLLFIQFIFFLISELLISYSLWVIYGFKFS